MKDSECQTEREIEKERHREREVEIERQREKERARARVQPLRFSEPEDVLSKIILCLSRLSIIYWL